MPHSYCTKCIHVKTKYWVPLFNSPCPKIHFLSLCLPVTLVLGWFSRPHFLFHDRAHSPAHHPFLALDGNAGAFFSTEMFPVLALIAALEINLQKRRRQMVLLKTRPTVYFHWKQLLFRKISRCHQGPLVKTLKLTVWAFFCMIPHCLWYQGC